MIENNLILFKVIYMKVTFYFFLALFIIGTIFSIFWFVSPEFVYNLTKPKTIPISITLDNQCSFTDEAFIVLNPKSGRTAKFYGGKAIIYLPENAKVKLTMSSEYPDFVYDGDLEKVKENMTLEANCEISPRLKNIFDSMNKRFSK